MTDFALLVQCAVWGWAVWSLARARKICRITCDAQLYARADCCVYPIMPIVVNHTSEFFLMKRLILWCACIAIVAGCQTQSDQPILEIPPTATLLPVVSQTPRTTATLEPTRTPLPTFTSTPTETVPPPTNTLSPTPSPTPTVAGVVSSLQRVNVREGPGVDFSAIAALDAGTGLLIIGQNVEGTWYNVRLEDDTEGWISARLVRIAPTPTVFPTFTPTPDLTALFLGTPLATQQPGGGTISPTPPDQVRTGTPGSAVAQVADATPTSGDGRIAVPIVTVGFDEAFVSELDGTATALVANAATRTPVPSGTPPRQVTVEGAEETAQTQEGDSAETSASGPPTPTVDINTVDGRDIFAYCDDLAYGFPAPFNLRDGVVIDIWWAWFASTAQQVQDHIDHVSHELRVNGELIEDINDFVEDIRPVQGGYAAYWYVPYGPLAPGDYEITWVAQWDEAIDDGLERFGPDTDNPFLQETCSFSVFER